MRAPGGEVLKRDAPEAIATARTESWMARRGYLRASGARYRELEARDDAGRRLRGLEATPEGGAPVELWFDDADRLARTSQRLGPLTSVTDYSDWRDVDGIRLPFHAVVDRGDPRNRATLALASVHQRPAMPASAFAAAAPDAGRLQFTGGGHASELRFDDRSGLYLLRAHGGALRVAAVTPTGPAERAGVRVDDRITAIDGARIETRRLWQWRAYLREHAPATKVVLRIERAGAAPRDVAIQLAELVP